MISNYVRETLVEASGDNPATPKNEINCLKVRNLLITTFIIDNLRRSQEMAKFALKEAKTYSETNKDGKSYYTIHAERAIRAAG